MEFQVKRVAWSHGVLRRILPALFLLVLCVAPGPAASGEGDADERSVRAIFSDDIVEGIRKNDPDLYLRSYAPDARAFSFLKGEVPFARYREILAEDLRGITFTEVVHTVVYIRPEGERIRAKVLYVEKGTRGDGSPYQDRYHRYYRLGKVQGAWKIEVDGYNESFREIKSYHGRW